MAIYRPTFCKAATKRVKHNNIPKPLTKYAAGHLKGLLTSGYLILNIIMAMHTIMNENRAPTLDKVPITSKGIKPAINATTKPSPRIAT